jgi:hypothetical protein
MRFRHVLTSLVFAAHAVLGCGVHHACHEACAGAVAAGHSCSHHGHDEGPDAPPGEGEHSPGRPCQHLACSFVKADTVRVDQGEHVSWDATTLLFSARAEAAQRPGTAGKSICAADLSSAQVYVWHCALLI